MADNGLEDISGVKGPIEDPYQRERRRIFADPLIDIPNIKYYSALNPLYYFGKLTYYLWELPADIVHSFTDSIRVVKPRRYYHQKFRRVPNIWECDVEDSMCVYEAESQFRRDLKVDEEIVNLIEQRLLVCVSTEGENFKFRCNDVRELFEKVQYAFHVKYGGIGKNLNARSTLNKQKNRFIEDRYLARVGADKFPSK